VNLTKVAAKAFDQIKTTTPLDEDPKTNARIICIVDALVHDRGGDWEIAIFRRDAAAAFALPGGKIGVYSGLARILRSQDQLAAVIAHGIGHTLAHHPEQRVAAALQASPALDPLGALSRPRTADASEVLGLLGVPGEGAGTGGFDSAQEQEANALALELLGKAGFDPNGSRVAWRMLETNARSGASAFLALHPPHGDAQQAAEDRGMAAALAFRDEYLASQKKPDCDRIR
jgi:predicted Zn-dependent protease